MPRCPLIAIAFGVTALLSSAITLAARTAAIRVPDGYVVEPIAQPPLVERPMMAGFDDRGRLFVAESAGLNLDFEKLKENPPNFIRMLEDADGNGAFDRSTIFADRMTFPTGALWHDGALYVAAAPSIWKLEDRDNDGVCDRRTEIVTGFRSIGNGADLHGPFLGPDGWLYFSDGRNGHRVTLGDGTIWEGKAAAVYRCRTDGSGLEVVFGGGFDNPVEVVFTPQGELLVGCNLVVARPQRQDGILFGIEGGVYPHDPSLSEFPRTGELLKAVSDLGWVSISGLMRYDGTQLGETFNGNLFSAQFNPHRVQRHIVTRDGAGFRITNEDFLTSTNPDFHPTDVLQDPTDGSLLVVDTGGWFRIGCPASGVAKPDVLGGIYRIRRKDPTRAIGIADKPQAEESAVWVPFRRNTSDGHTTVRHAIGDADANVRLAAVRAAGLAGDRDAVTPLLKALAATQPAESREAASALGRIGDASATAPLLAALKLAADRFHEHAIIHALIRIADGKGVAAGLADPNAIVRRGALIALDQMPGGKLTAGDVVPRLNAPEAALRDEAFIVAAKHPEWAGQVAEQLRTALADGRGDVAGLVSAFGANPSVQEVVAAALRNRRMTPASKAALLEAVAAARIDTLPDAWVTAIREILAAPQDESVSQQAIDVVRARGLAPLHVDVLRIARDSKFRDGLRLAAFGAVATFTPNADDFAFLTAQLDPLHEPLTRLAAARVLAGLSLTDEQLISLAKRLAAAGPLEAPTLLSAFEKSNSPAVKAALDAAVAKSKSLRPPVDAEQMSRKLAELEPLLIGGDASRGQAVFFGKRATCTTCHAVGGSGAHVGPDLTKIGASRSGRDLLESTVFPSSTIARGFEPFVLETKDGHAYAGTLAGETADAIRLKTPAEVLVPRSQVKTFRPDRVSIMPQGLDAQLTKQELADLLAFLQACK